jgi:hypothetical protein
MPHPKLNASCGIISSSNSCRICLCTCRGACACLTVSGRVACPLRGAFPLRGACASPAWRVRRASLTIPGRVAITLRIRRACRAMIGAVACACAIRPLTAVNLGYASYASGSAVHGGGVKGSRRLPDANSKRHVVEMPRLRPMQTPSGC